MASDIAKKGKQIASKVNKAITSQIARERDTLISKTTGGITKKNEPVEAIVRTAASVVGLISEIIHHRQQKKNNCFNGDGKEKQDNFQRQETENSTRSSLLSCDNQNQTPAEASDAKSSSNPEPNITKSLADAFLSRHSLTTDFEVKSSTLALPVVLPQRRPKTRARGFVRAYAPDLAAVGIDQATFLDFIDTLNKSLEPNPYIYAINLAGLAGLASPEPFSFMIGVGIGIATDAAMEVQSRHKSARLFDRLNSEFFMPHGLICLLVTWSPDSKDNASLIGSLDPSTDPSASFANSNNEPYTSINDRIDRMSQKMRQNMKFSNGALNWARSASLIFVPSDDENLADQGEYTGNTNKKNALDRGEMWLDNFMDKRARAKWIKSSPESKVASSLPKPQFYSRYADPNHPAASGDIVAFATGGSWSSKREDKKKTKLKHTKTSKKEEEHSKEKHPKSDHSFLGLFQKVNIIIRWDMIKWIANTWNIGCCIFGYHKSSSGIGECIRKVGGRRFM